MSTISDSKLKAALLNTINPEDRSKSEIANLAELMFLFARLPDPPKELGTFSEYPALHRVFIDSIGSGNDEKTEEAFLELYCHLHGYEAPYTTEERNRIDQTGGYWCHAGGISPIIKAGPWISENTVLSDYGAGNGLQGLLYQKLYPHKRTVQIEISSESIEIGRRLQSWLKIPENKVQWITADVCDIPPVKMDFIYLYRPLKPVGEGDRFYRRFAGALVLQNRPITIFSIADCLRQYLPDDFRVFYSDGHLTCFRFDPDHNK